MRILHIAWGFTPWRFGGLIDYTEDLMTVQQEHGHEVAYFCAGRHYPFMRKTKLKKWRRGNMPVYEVINSPIIVGGDEGTLLPELELREEHSEKCFLETLAEFRPDIINIQELLGLPTSLIALAKRQGIPVVHTMHDYYPLCPTLKLSNYEDAFCAGRDVGEKCVRCCLQGQARFKPQDTFNKIGKNLWLTEIQPGPWRMPAWLVHKMLKMAGYLPMWLARKGSAKKGKTAKNELLTAAGSPELPQHLAVAFQKRRDVNVSLLNRLDLLIAQSHRQAEIYHTLGVHPDKIAIVPSTQKHLEHLTPKTIESINGPLIFATMNGCASEKKGARIVLSALRLLREQGLTERFKFIAWGYVSEEVKGELLQFDNVEVRGLYHFSNLESLLEEVHVGIIPSIWEEVYGIVGIELLAKGIPIIGNNVGGIVDYTKDDLTGWINRTNSAEGLAQIMAAIINEPDQVVRLNHSIRMNRHRIVKFMKTHFEEIDEIYKAILKARQSRGMSSEAYLAESASQDEPLFEY